MVLNRDWRMTSIFAALLFSVTGCALPSYKLPAGYSGSDNRYLDAHDRNLPKMVTETRILPHESVPSEIRTGP